MTSGEAVLRGTLINDEARIKRLKDNIARTERELAAYKRELAETETRFLVGKLYKHLLDEAA